MRNSVSDPIWASFFPAASPVARIEQLKAIEQDVVGILESAGLCLQELGKEKPGSQKAIEAHNQQVPTTLLLLYF